MKKRLLVLLIFGFSIASISNDQGKLPFGYEIWGPYCPYINGPCASPPAQATAIHTD